LCSRCQEKIDKGEVSKSYVGIAKILLDLEAKGMNALNEVHLLNVAEVNDVLVLVFRRGDLTKIRPVRGKLAKSLEEETGKRVHMVEGDVDERSFLEQLLWPATLITINKIWLPDDSVITRVVLRGRRPWARTEVLAEVARELKGLNLRVEFMR